MTHRAPATHNREREKEAPAPGLRLRFQGREGPAPLGGAATGAGVSSCSMASAQMHALDTQGLLGC